MRVVKRFHLMGGEIPHLITYLLGCGSSPRGLLNYSYRTRAGAALMTGFEGPLVGPHAAQKIRLN